MKLKGFFFFPYLFRFGVILLIFFFFLSAGMILWVSEVVVFFFFPLSNFVNYVGFYM